MKWLWILPCFEIAAGTAAGADTTSAWGRNWERLVENALGSRPARLGFLPPNIPYHQRVCNCLREAGFTGVRVGVNKDFSMVTSWLSQDEHPAQLSEFQAQLAILNVLDSAGILSEANSVVVDIRAGKVCGAFLPIRKVRASAEREFRKPSDPA